MEKYLWKKQSADLFMRRMNKLTACIAMFTALLIYSPNIIFAADGCDEALSKGKAETLNPDSDAVKKAIDDYAWVSGLEAGWNAVGRKQDTKTWVDDVGDVVDTVRNPLEKAAEKGLSSLVSYHTNSKITMLYDAYKQKMAYQEAPADNKPKITLNFDKNANLEFEAIKDFARSAGCPPDPNFESLGSNENRFFRAWIEERYRKEKEATEIISKANKYEIPINVLSPKRGKADVPGAVFGKNWTSEYDRKISTNPYTSYNRRGQMDWNYDVLRYAVAKYKKFEKTLEDRLDEIFKQNGLPKNTLKLCYSMAKDTVIKDFTKKAYDLICQGKDAEVTEYLNKEVSENVCKFLPGCLPLDFKNKKLDCKKKDTPKTKTDTKTDSKPKDPGKKDQSAVPKSKEELYGCICRCTINPTVGVGATYDPIAWKNASPSCDDARYGPCVGFGLGCWRNHMKADGECFESCVKQAGLDKQDVINEITKVKDKAFNDFIGEARGIIEEYLSFKEGLYRKKTSRDGPRKNDYILLAANLSDEALQGQILFASATPSGSVPMSYVEVVKEKNRRGDPDRALGLVNAAQAVMPQRSEVVNILAEFAIIMSKASLNIATDLEFDEGLYLLRKAAEFHKAGASNALGQDIKRLTSAFEMWKKSWETLQRDVPQCLAMIKEKRVCECEKLNNEKITPASNSLDIREQASANKWEIGWSPGAPRSIPKKDTLMAPLKQSLQPAIQECAANPAVNTPDMAQLKGYEQYKFLDKSPYIKSEDLRKSSTLPISDEQAVKKAEKLLGEPGLCDCERDKIKTILDTAKEDLKSSKLEVGLTSNKKTLTLGEYVRVHLSIKNGRKPYSYIITGDLTASERRTESGLVTEYPPKTPGGKSVKAVVTDAAGDSRTVAVSFDVLPVKGTASSKTGSGQTGSGPTGPPVYDPTKDRGYRGGGKQVDIASVDKAGKDFQDTGWGIKKTDGKAMDSQVAAQSDAYTESGKKQDEGKEVKPPYPPYTPTPNSLDNTGGYPGGYPGKTRTDLYGGSNTGSGWGTSPPQNTGSRTGSGYSSSPTSSSPFSSSGSGPSSSPASSTSTSSSSPAPSPGTSSSSGSTSSTAKTSPGGWRFTATYENKTDTIVHIFAEGGETFSGNNRLAPGEKRNVSLIMPSSGRIKFISGRNGQVISSGYWDGDPNDLNRYPMVRFVKGMGGKEELLITTNLK